MKNYKNILQYISEYKDFNEKKLKTTVRELEPELRERILGTIEVAEDVLRFLNKEQKKVNPS